MDMSEIKDRTTVPDSATALSKGGRIIVAIASAGRGPILSETVAALGRQHRLPDLLLLSLGDPADGIDIAPEQLPFAVSVLIGPKGLTTQRNAILRALLPGDVVLMLDDDFLLAPDYIARLETLFDDHP
ncbi:hypothetical protein LCGC14_2577090, partial [marine sediment metagenome]